jgi:hypothetical protein
MLRSKRAETDASRSDGRALFPAVALLAAAAAIEYLLPGGGERSGVSLSAGSRATTDDDGRGRLATTPSEIPPRGWKDILLRCIRMYRSTGSWLLRRGMTYYSLFAIFPALAALVAGYGLFADPAAIARDLDHDAEMEHQIARDTTTGAPKPVRTRGAPGKPTRLERPRGGDAEPLLSRSGSCRAGPRSEGARAERTPSDLVGIVAGTEFAGSSKWRVPYWLSMTIRSGSYRGHAGGPRL